MTESQRTEHTEKLRKDLKKHLENSERGELARISESTGMNGGNLSQFSNGKISQIIYENGKKIEEYLK